MIKFTCFYSETYNLLIHHFLTTMLFTYHGDIGMIVEKVMPVYLRREQYNVCERTFFDLIDWTNSSEHYLHELDMFHNLALYKFLKFLQHKQETMKTFSKKYFPKKIQNEIDRLIYERILNEDFDAQVFKQRFYQIRYYYEQLFTNLDFLKIENLIRENKLYSEVQKNFHAYKKYYEIMPLKIRRKYTVYKVSLYKEIEKILQFLLHMIQRGNLAYLFWNEDVPISEPEIQIALDSIFSAYFAFVQIDINREVSVGSGEVDFKFYRNKEIVLFEIKKANNDLLHGYEIQLPRYMNSLKCHKAYYLIFCFSEKEVEKAKAFVLKNKRDDGLYRNINIYVLDVRKNRKKYFSNYLALDRTVSLKNDKMIKYIANILSISTPMEILEYFKKLRDNYYQIDNPEIQKLYFQTIRGLPINPLEHVEAFERNFYQSFYKVIDENVLVEFSKKVFQTIQNEESLKNACEYIFSYLKLSTSTSTTLTHKKVDTIFELIKNKMPRIYKILSKVFIDIYIFPYVEITDTYHVLLFPNGYLIPCINAYAEIFLVYQIAEVFLQQICSQYPMAFTEFSFFENPEEFVSCFACFLFETHDDISQYEKAIRIFEQLDNFLKQKGIEI